jgi:hypothetical protein
MGRLLLRKTISHIAALGLVFGQVAVAEAAAPKPGGTGEPTFTSNPVVQGATPPAAATEAAPLVETEKEIKARLKAETQARKQAEKAERDRLKAEERERRRAESRANGGDKTGKAILGCIGGGLLMAGLTALLGGKRNNVAAAAAVGCAAGIAFAVLTKKDNEKLNTYVNDEFMVQDESCSKIWYAEESKHSVNVSCGQTTYQTARHTFYVEDDVAFDPANIQVAESVKYATNSVRLRSAPLATSANNIVGGYNRGAKLLAYGTTNDGKWTYIVEKLPSGGYELLGYAATSLLSDKSPSPAARTMQYARLQATPKSSNRAAARRTSVARAENAQSASVRPTKKVDIVANTRCKTVNVSVGKESKSTSSCGGARLALLQPKGQKGEKA